MRRLLGVSAAPQGHWVGDGFPVRTLFSHASLGEQVSPFLLADYAGPARFEPTSGRRGVGGHPHRGFETVTIVYAGEVEHRDSTGAGGVIGPGDVQWMTAGAGVVHEEFHSAAFARTGGPFEMVQLWVNLPARDKDAAPGYQSLQAAEIPTVALPDGAGALRVIAGSFGGASGPARTFTPIDVWDVLLTAGAVAELAPPEGQTVAVVALDGGVRINDAQPLAEAEVATLAREGGGFRVEAASRARLLVLSGEPIDEPVVMHGPFVMNTSEQIRKAVADFRDGRFGAIPG